MQEIDLVRILAETLKNPSVYEMDTKELMPVVRACEFFVKAILAQQDEATRDLYCRNIANKLEWLGDRLFLNVSPSKPSPAEFREQYDIHWQKTCHPGAAHLEIGTWTAWPIERVNTYLQEQNIGDIIRLDMNHEFMPDIAASATQMPLKDGSVDRISSNSLLEHVAYPHDILREAYRILKPGGVFYTAVPFHFVQHDCPSDYLRYTGAFFKDVCKDLGFSEVYLDTSSTGGVYYTIQNLAKAAVVEQTLPEKERTIARQFHLAVLMLLGSLQALDDDFLAYGASHWHTTNVIAIKDGEYRPGARTFDRKRPFVKRWSSFFISPDTKEPLTVEGDKLVSKDPELTYDIINGVPVLLPKINKSASIL